MEELIPFLLARIADDEVVAWSAENRIFPTTWREDVATLRNEHVRQHVDRYNPARVLAECEAKRRIVNLAVPDGDGGFPDGWWAAHQAVLQLLALPYADHLDYREEWRP